MKFAIVFLAFFLISHEIRAELVSVKTVTYSNAAVLLSEKKFMNRRMELISSDGGITVGRFRGVQNGTLLLQDATAVPLCSVTQLRISRKTASPLRRGLGIAGGIFGGAMIGGPFALALAFAGAETGAVITYLTFPIIGGVAGSKLVAKRQDSVLILDRDSRQASCEEPSN